MVNFEKEITDITEVKSLLTLKEEIKCQILDPNLHWETRMSLYKKVQLIKERIEQLQHDVR